MVSCVAVTFKFFTETKDPSDVLDGNTINVELFVTKWHGNSTDFDSDTDTDIDTDSDMGAFNFHLFLEVDC